MPKNKGKGGRAHRKGRGEAAGADEVLWAEPGQAYAKVTRMLGAAHVEAVCTDGVTRQAHIRGAMRKRVWIALGDIVLVGLRDYQPAVADVLHRYTPTAARALKTAGQLPASFTLPTASGRAGAGEDRGDGDAQDDDGFEFGSDAEDEATAATAAATARAGAGKRQPRTAAAAAAANSGGGEDSGDSDVDIDAL